MYNEIPLIIPEDGFLNSNTNKEGFSSIKKKKKTWGIKKNYEGQSLQDIGFFMKLL